MVSFQDKERDEFRLSIRKHATIHEDMKRFFDGFPLNSHPMAILSSIVTALSAFHPSSDSHDVDKIDENIVRLMARVKTKPILIESHMAYLLFTQIQICLMLIIFYA